MQDIEFRGMDKNGIWRYGFYYRDPSCYDRHCISSIGVSYSVNHKTIGQYTGRKDKNTKKIFEGDRAIITYKYITRAVDITFRDCSFWITDNDITNFVCWLGSGGITSIEIIGNIHENPDLLK